MEPINSPGTYYNPVVSAWSIPTANLTNNGYGNNSLKNPLFATTVNTSSTGTLSAEFFRNSQVIATMTMYVVNVPATPTFSPSPPTVCNGGSATWTVDPKTTAWSSIQWEGFNGALVNGSTSYSGGTSVTVSLNSANGYVRARVIDNCGKASDWLGARVGTPVITSATVNNGPIQYPNYVSNPAQLQVYTDGPGTSYSWSILNGNGSIYPTTSSCQTYAYNFVRVFAQTSNGCGTGDSFTFYIQADGTNSYRVYPNPADTDLTVAFDYDNYAEKLLNDVTLYNEKSVAVKKFDVADAKAKDQFKQSNAVKMSVKDLAPGTYYLHVQVGDKVNKERISVKQK